MYNSQIYYMFIKPNIYKRQISIDFMRRLSLPSLLQTKVKYDFFDTLSWLLNAQFGVPQICIDARLKFDREICSDVLLSIAMIPFYPYLWLAVPVPTIRLPFQPYLWLAFRLPTVGSIIHTIPAVFFIMDAHEGCPPLIDTLYYRCVTHITMKQ